MVIIHRIYALKKYPINFVEIKVGQPVPQRIQVLARVSFNFLKADMINTHADHTCSLLIG
jgi:hypothetical protein